MCENDRPYDYPIVLDLKYGPRDKDPSLTAHFVFEFADVSPESEEAFAPIVTGLSRKYFASMRSMDDVIAEHGVLLGCPCDPSA